MTIPYKKIIYTVLNIVFIAAVAYETKSFTVTILAALAILQQYAIQLTNERVSLVVEQRKRDMLLVARLANATKQICTQMDTQADVIGKLQERVDQRQPRRGQKV